MKPEEIKDIIKKVKDKMTMLFNIKSNTSYDDVINELICLEIKLSAEEKELEGAELKPCPFCGSKNIRRSNYGSDGQIVGCANCGVSTKFHESMKEAIEAWNNRPEIAWTKHQRLLTTQGYLKRWVFLTEGEGLPRNEEKALERINRIEKELKKCS